MNKQGSIAYFDTDEAARAAGYTLKITKAQAEQAGILSQPARVVWRGEEIARRRAANRAARKARKARRRAGG